MLKKLGIVLMAGFFTVSVAGLSFADEMKGMTHDAVPAGTPAKNPCDPSSGKDKAKQTKKAAKNAAKKKAAAKAETVPAQAAPTEKK